MWTIGDGERADVWEALATVPDNAGQLDVAEAAYRSALPIFSAGSPLGPWLFERRAWVSTGRGDVPGAIRLSGVACACSMRTLPSRLVDSKLASSRVRP